MVIYDLVCDLHHIFEGWFKDSGDYQSQLDSGLLSCPVCDSQAISKKPTAAKLTSKSNIKAGSNAVYEQYLSIDGTESVNYLKLQKMLSKVHRFIDQNFEDVGNRFADEALSIHRGEKEAINIKGTANSEQREQLLEEGVDVMPLPPKPVDKKNLN